MQKGQFSHDASEDLGLHQPKRHDQSSFPVRCRFSLFGMINVYLLDNFTLNIQCYDAMFGIETIGITLDSRV
jgi:hypothetical protein